MSQSVLALLFQSIYVLCVIGLSIYGANALWLSILHQIGPDKRARSFRLSQPMTPSGPPRRAWHAPHLRHHSPLPVVTIQLPIYNEQHVVVRLMRACAAICYPQDRLQIQVLDDSDDHTRLIIEKEAKRLRRTGIEVEQVTRSTRDGFKAGALKHGLATAKGEFIAIFDADFEPSEDFLRDTLPQFLISDNHRLGFVQTRWAHLNAEYSPLTQSQALALDGHFAIEQPTRQATGYFFGFNGSGGIWRRACIEDPAVGGWQTDTLCEDLDLSYRAQLAGWQGGFLPDVTSPAEIPPQLLAFKRQQFRWAKGSIQTLGKLGRRVCGSAHSLPIKIQALIHMGSYWVHPLLLLLLLITLPLELLPVDPVVPLPWLSLTSFGPPLLYALGQRRLYGNRWWNRWRYLPLLTLFGMGLSLNNSMAVVQGLFQRGGEFLRTPKFKVESRNDQWRASQYRLPVPPIIFAELLLMLYALATCVVLILHQNWWSLPFLLIYAAGFGLMAAIGIWQSRPAVKETRPTPAPTSDSIPRRRLPPRQPARRRLSLQRVDTNPRARV